MSENTWIGVDLDRTLAFYDEWRGAGHIGAPIQKTVDRVKAKLAEGIEVRIFTARVSPVHPPHEVAAARLGIENWCRIHIGRALPITHEKDMHMWELWDDRAVQYIPNTGDTIDDELNRLTREVWDLHEKLDGCRAEIEDLNEKLERLQCRN
jgi:hypothetical protein